MGYGELMKFKKSSKRIKFHKLLIEKLHPHLIFRKIKEKAIYDEVFGWSYVTENCIRIRFPSNSMHYRALNKVKRMDRRRYLFDKRFDPNFKDKVLAVADAIEQIILEDCICH